MTTKLRDPCSTSRSRDARALSVDRRATEDGHHRRVPSVSGRAGRSDVAPRGRWRSLGATHPVRQLASGSGFSAAFYSIGWTARGYRRGDDVENPAKSEDFGRRRIPATRRRRAGQPVRLSRCPWARTTAGERGSTPEPRLGAIRAGGAELGPISPELALVDPALAETARQLLPDPRERSTSRPRPVAASTPLRVVEQPEQTARPARPRRRGWRRTVLLAGLVLVFGAVAGGFFAERPAVSPETTLEIRSGAPTETRSDREKQPAQKSASSSAGAPLQLPKVGDEPHLV